MVYEAKFWNSEDLGLFQPRILRYYEGASHETSSRGVPCSRSGGAAVLGVEASVVVAFMVATSAETDFNERGVLACA
jgi:hypothetical protein